MFFPVFLFIPAAYISFNSNFFLSEFEWNINKLYDKYLLYSVYHTYEHYVPNTNYIGTGMHGF